MGKNVAVVALVLAAVAFIGFGIWVVTRADLSGKITASGDLRPAEDVSLQVYNGDVVRLSDYFGQPLVVNTWATWCPFCVDELPDFVEIQDEFGDEVLIMAINRAENKEATLSYIDELGINDKLLFLLDSQDSFYKTLKGFAMPQTLFIDSDGNVFDHKKGFMRLEEIRERVQNLLDHEMTL